MLDAIAQVISEAVNLVRLACVRHAASVRPEPGSNSRLIFSGQAYACVITFCYFFCSSFRTFSQFYSQIYLLPFGPIYLEFIAVDLPLFASQTGLGHTRFFLCCFIVYVLFLLFTVIL